MSNKVKEIVTGELINDILYRAVRKMHRADNIDDKQTAILEKLAKIHSIMNANAREAAKSGLFGSLNDSEMDAIVEQLKDVEEVED